jgi:type II secretory pathway pseudopilin PulG
MNERQKKRRGGPLRPPIKGTYREASLRFPELPTPNSKLFFRNRGFTLIELIILIVMAGILLPTIIVPFVTAVKGSGKPEMATRAMVLAHQRMEEFTKFHYPNAALNPTALTAYANIPGFTGYQWQWEIYYVDSDFANPDLGTDRGYKRIFVRVKDPMNDTYEICSVVSNFP